MEIKTEMTGVEKQFENLPKEIKDYVKERDMLLMGVLVVLVLVVVVVAVVAAATTNSIITKMY